MRVLAVVVVLFGLATSSASIAEARKRPAKHTRTKTKKPVAVTSSAKATRKLSDRSIGAPWSGRLQAPVRLERGDGYYIRRPWRTYGTRSTVAFLREAIRDTLEVHPKVHVLAIGDLSAEGGGRITEHNSHQSGRDVDIGLFYKSKPAGYPSAFKKATAATLDAASMWTLLSNLARTAGDDGGVQMMFLDQRLQNAIYDWAVKRGISDRRIWSVFRLLQHIPHHDNHLHVRFKCRDRDTACR
jgi:murein endopeptidase